MGKKKEKRSEYQHWYSKIDSKHNINYFYVALDAQASVCVSLREKKNREQEIFLSVLV